MEAWGGHESENRLTQQQGPWSDQNASRQPAVGRVHGASTGRTARTMTTGTYQATCHQAVAGAARPYAGSGAFAAWALISGLKPRSCDITTVMNTRARRLQESSP
jgi:hypothetical protein